MAASPGASAAAQDAVAAPAVAGRATAAVGGAARAGAGREAVVAATTKVGGMIGGATGGGSLGGWAATTFKDDIKGVVQPVGDAASTANDAILDGVKGAATGVQNLGNQTVGKGERK